MSQADHRSLLSWVNPPLLSESVQAGPGVGLMRFCRAGQAGEWEAAFAPRPLHALVWRVRGDASDVRVAIDHRQDTPPAGRWRNGYLVPASAEALWTGSHGRVQDAIHLYLEAGWLGEFAQEAGLPAEAALLAPRFGLPPRLARLMRALHAFWAANGAPMRSFLDSWAVLVAHELLRSGRPPPGAAPLDARSLARALRAATGEAPSAHLQRERASALLGDGRLSADEVAWSSGFPDAGRMRRSLRRAGLPARDRAKP